MAEHVEASIVCSAENPLLLENNQARLRSKAIKTTARNE